jgi:ABC-2 type transport system permease protein
MTFLFPAIILALSVGMQIFGTEAIETAGETASSIEQTDKSVPIGYVDEAKIIDKLPDWVPVGYLERYQNENLAKEALESGVIRQYYYIPADFLAKGRIIMVDKDYQPLRSSGNAEIFENIIRDTLIRKDPMGAVLVDPTVRINSHALAPSSELDKDDPMTFAVPMGTLFVFFFVISTSSGFMLTSVTKEKENRTAETLLVSLKPRDLMVGKITGLSVIALFQMSVWLGGAILTLENSRQLFSLVSNYDLPSGFVFWTIIFFILGYFLYASILGSIGVLSPNAREGGQFTFVAVLPLLLPLWFNYTFTETPDGPVAVFLSLFPLTAPSSMIARLTNSYVPITQILLSLAGLITTTYLFILLSSRLFRADTFLSTDSFRWKKIISEFRKKNVKDTR